MRAVGPAAGIWPCPARRGGWTVAGRQAY